jgi:hypothetical protein
VLQTDLYAYLKDTAQIADLFGSRIFHEWMPQGNDEWPSLVFFLTSETEIAEDMEQPGDDKIDQSNYQFDIYGRKSKATVEAGGTFDKVFRNFTGTMGATRIQRIELSSKAHLGEIVGDKTVRRVSLDYAIFHDA